MRTSLLDTICLKIGPGPRQITDIIDEMMFDAFGKNTFPPVLPKSVTLKTVRQHAQKLAKADRTATYYQYRQAYSNILMKSLRRGISSQRILVDNTKNPRLVALNYVHPRNILVQTHVLNLLRHPKLIKDLKVFSIDNSVYVVIPKLGCIVMPAALAGQVSDLIAKASIDIVGAELRDQDEKEEMFSMALL